MSSISFIAMPTFASSQDGIALADQKPPTSNISSNIHLQIVYIRHTGRSGTASACDAGIWCSNLSSPTGSDSKPLMLAHVWGDTHLTYRCMETPGGSNWLTDTPTPYGAATCSEWPHMAVEMHPLCFVTAAHWSSVTKRTPTIAT